MTFNFNNLEVTEKKNPIVIYHKNCADGFGAAWCFWNAQEKLQETFDFHPGVYQEVPPDVTGRIVYLVDFSYKKAVVQEMLKVAEKIYLIDHHKTAIEDLWELVDNEEYPNFQDYTDLERSGARLAWDFIHNCSQMWDENVESRMYNHKPGDPLYVPPPLLLEHIEDRDLWRFKLPLTREIQASIFSQEYDFQVWDKLMASDRAELVKIASEGMGIERKHFKDIRELLAVSMRMAVIDHINVPVANLPYTMSSDAGNIMARDLARDTFAACYMDTKAGRVFSLRSVATGMDVSEIAKKFGGGGHTRAAGFTVPRDHPLAIL